MRQDGGAQIPRPIHNKGIFVHKIPRNTSAARQSQVGFLLEPEPQAASSAKGVHTGTQIVEVVQDLGHGVDQEPPSFLVWPPPHWLI